MQNLRIHELSLLNATCPKHGQYTIAFPTQVATLQNLRRDWENIYENWIAVLKLPEAFFLHVFTNFRPQIWFLGTKN